MNEETTQSKGERETIMQAIEALNTRCFQLGELSGLTNKLNRKLNRTEDDPSALNGEEKESNPHRNIVDLIFLVSDRMEDHINVIGNNTESSIRMID